MEAATSETRTLFVSGQVMPETWNRLGTRILLRIGPEISVTVDGAHAAHVESELKTVLEELGLSGKLTVSRQPR